MRNLALLESETAATVARVRAEIAAIQERAANENRPLTAEEHARADELLREANAAKATLERRRSDDAMSAMIQQLGGGAGGGALGVTDLTGRGLVRSALHPSGRGAVASVGTGAVVSSTMTVWV